MNTGDQDTRSSTRQGSPISTDELQNMWRTRPARAANGSTIAGVCAGIGARYRVDPTLVKVAFIVGALFGGAGVVLYIAAWVLLPEGTTSPQATPDSEAQRSHPGHGFRHASSHPPAIVGIVVVVIVVLAAGPHLAWSGGGIVGGALMLLSWWLLYQRTPVPEPGTSVDTLGQRPVQSATPGSWWQSPTGTSTAAPDGGQFQRWTPRAWLKDDLTGSDTGGEPPAADASPSTLPDPAMPTPPSWDPLGVAPFAWDLPEPSEPAVDKDRECSRFTPVVLGIAVIATAVAAAIAAEVDWLSPAKVASVGLAVVAAGLLIGAFLRRGAGLIPFAIPLAGFVVIASLIGGFGFPSGPVGDRDWKPITSADLRDEYKLAMGTGRLDLTVIDLTADKKVEVDLGVGEFKIIAPAGMNLRTTCDVAVGETKCPDGLDGGTDGATGPVLTVDADATVGNLEVIRE